MTKAERLQLWIVHPEGVPAVKSKHDIVCGQQGISPMVANAAKTSLHMWPRCLHSSYSSTESGCSIDSDVDTFSTSASGSDEASTLPWDQWESFAVELDSPGELQRCRFSRVGAAGCAWRFVIFGCAAAG